MVARVSLSLTSLIISVISLSLLLLWCTTTTTFIRPYPPPIPITKPQEQQYYQTLSTRRALIDKKKLSPSTNFDFTPFIHAHQQHHHQHPSHGTEINPLYGVEMRLVPTGPNPLHH
ncbi:hypothetical protein QVD17_10564 [Tagetes erecta]|uniref:Uncharacterized protein n=1 Tax=Tagetes erecta TaxID=13708 RepID=A0AAD8NZL6_TARER|nr:hypothetical protein QVD17_10564 [Tagetes erecta]